MRQSVCDMIGVQEVGSKDLTHLHSTHESCVVRDISDLLIQHY